MYIRETVFLGTLCKMKIWRVCLTDNPFNAENLIGAFTSLMTGSAGYFVFRVVSDIFVHVQQLLLQVDMATTNKSMRDSLAALLKDAKEDRAALAEIRRNAKKRTSDLLTQLANQAVNADGSVKKADSARKDAEQASSKAREASAVYDRANRAAADAKIKMERAAQQYKDAEASNKRAKDILDDATRHILTEAYRQDARKMEIAERWHWFGVMVMLIAIVLTHTLAVGVVIDGVRFALAESDRLYTHVLAIPFWFGLSMVSRSLNEKRILQAECLHTARVLSATIGFKREFGDLRLKDPALEAIGRNPAKRLKANTDGMWSIVQKLTKPRGVRATTTSTDVASWKDQGTGTKSQEKES